MSTIANRNASRMGTPMRLIVLLLFVAEHDDHHRATITALRVNEFERDLRVDH